MRSFIQRLRVQLPPSGEHTDERLLDDFLAHREAGLGTPQDAEAAFTAIVRRHGPMVRGVCRRVLRNDADADDAFQAVFVVLLRKASAVRPRNQLGNWLYGVAVNVARRGRDTLTRRRTQELTTDVPDRATPERQFGGAENNDLRAVIDQELSGLPDAYRAAVVACDLEGHTRAEAAGRLGWSEGTVASRLARGRALLADRLARRGVVVPAAGLVAALGSLPSADAMTVNFHLLSTGPPPAVEALAQEALKAMTTSKLKTAAVVLLAVVGLTGAGAATVWACGGYGARLKPVPPVSEAKPFPFESVETRPAKSNDTPAAWEKPAPKELVASGTDKPAGSDTVGVAGVAKPALFVMQNPAKDITIISDRHETFVEFFRRQPVMVAHVPANVLDKVLYDAKGPTGLVFVDSASFNVDGPRAASYGASVKLAPVPFNSPVSHLLELIDQRHSVVLVRDPADKDLWHAAGVAKRSPVGFFATKERVKPDDFAPADLLQDKPEKKDAAPKKDEPKKEMKPTKLVNPGKDIFIISDRDETIPEFFHRQTVVVGGANEKTVELLAQGKGTADEVFVDYTRANDDLQMFGTFAKIAEPSAEVKELITERLKADPKAKNRLSVIMLRDQTKTKEKVFHIVGVTLRSHVRFFENKTRSEGDDFAPTDLRKPKKE
jgi:RNA polymerase sigma factor (sigma-70 family)